ncbi:MAG TPA: heavy metal translocating P-type ATPase [Acidimicrobiales bacterium]
MTTSHTFNFFSLAKRYAVTMSLVFSILGLVVGAYLHWVKLGHVGNGVWLVVATLGIVTSLSSMIRSLMHRRLGVDVIALLALVGAAMVREYLAAALIGVMLATGQILETWASGRAKRELDALVTRTPKTAHRYRESSIEIVALEEVAIGDHLMIASGAIVPVDGTVVGLPVVLDESALTGEPLPVTHEPGEGIRSGVVNAGAPFEMCATASAADSTFSGIIRLVDQARSTQPSFVRLADKYALVFLAITIATASVGWIIDGSARAVTVLVVATPCPLILAAPVAFVAGLSRAAHRNIIIRGGAALEKLAKCRTLLIDKTGTITRGQPEFVKLVSAGKWTQGRLLELAGSVDQMSPHVVAAAVVRAALNDGATLLLPTNVTERPGQGIVGTIEGHVVAVGNAEWTGITDSPDWAKSARRDARQEGLLIVFVAIDSQPAGMLIFEDPLRSDAARTIRSLRHGGIQRVVLVTGDRFEVGEMVGAVIGVDEVFADRSPQEKLDVVDAENHLSSTLMVGDGINDAPALALADVGVAMGARGATAASEAADVIITVDRLDRLNEAIVIARRTRGIALQSIVVGMSLSVIAMGFALLGFLPATWGAILQEFIDALVIFNSLRAMKISTVERRLSVEDSALTQRFHEEHRDVSRVISDLLRFTDDLKSVAGDSDLVEARRIFRSLVDVVLPHEDAEEKLLYPALGVFLGGNDPMATMSRAHIEITHRIHRLGQLLDEIGTSADETDLIELRRTLYGLYAILKLHTAQEEESYLSLGDEAALDTFNSKVA